MAQADKAYEDWEAQVSLETDPAKIEAGLTDKDPIVRQEFARKTNVQLSPSQIDRGLADESDDVRLAFAKRTDFTPTTEQAERGLTDSNPEIAIAFAERKDFTPTSAQVLRGVTQQRLGRDDDNSLVDVNQSIREAFLRRDDAVMTQSDFDVAIELTDGADREAIENMQRRNIAHQAASQATELNPTAARLQARNQQIAEANKGKPANPNLHAHIKAARETEERIARERQQQQQQQKTMSMGMR